jgi:hypothetical protein
MSNGEGPPPIFEVDDFPYWKIHMEAYLEAIDVGCLRATTEGLPKIKDPANPVGDKEKYDRWNAKAKNARYRGLVKDIFNHVRNAKNTHELWENLCALHEGTKSEREKRYHIVLKKINSFKMLPKESANDMYTRLNVLVEDLNALGLTQMSPSDVARRILSVLSVEKYVHIITVLHQSDLSTATPTQVLENINAHEMYMHITLEEGSSSSKKKDLAFKASHDKKTKKSQAMTVHESSSESDIDDA